METNGVTSGDLADRMGKLESEIEWTLSGMGSDNSEVVAVDQSVKLDRGEGG